MSGAPTSEGQLIRRARDGDEDAFADLVGIHADRVYGALRRFGLDASEAEELMELADAAMYRAKAAGERVATGGDEEEPAPNGD